MRRGAGGPGCRRRAWLMWPSFRDYVRIVVLVLLYSLRVLPMMAVPERNLDFCLPAWVARAGRGICGLWHHAEIPLCGRWRPEYSPPANRDRAPGRNCLLASKKQPGEIYRRAEPAFIYVGKNKTGQIGFTALQGINPTEF